jgi:uncharacterized RDD family membrane protein YckC
MSETSSQEYIVPAKRRVAAFVIDDLVISFLFMAIFWSQLSQLSDIDAINAFLTDNFFIIVAIKLLYHTIFIWQNGMTLGKYMMKMRVVFLQSGETPQFSTALMRAMIRIVSETFFYLGFLIAFFNPMVQTLHDKLSGCVVIDA